MSQLGIDDGAKCWQEGFLYPDQAEGSLVLHYYAMMEFIAQQIVERMNDSGHVKCPLRLLYNKRHDLLCCTKQGPHAKATEFWTYHWQLHVKIR